MSFIGARLIVRGVVQGVGFRYWITKKAQILNLPGYAKNRPDGTVEIETEGERGLVEEFIKEVKVGPTYSSVTDINIEWYDQPKEYKDFSIRY